VIKLYTSIQQANREGASLDKDLEILTNEMNSDVVDFDYVDVTITGNWIITNKITSSLTESQIISTVISLILASIVLVIVYRRFSLGAVAMIPVLISIVWILGTMYFIGYSLDVLTITVTSLTIGIGVDYAIHATERFRLIADKTGNIKKAMNVTISKTGGALLIAALTTTLGFAMLTLAPLPPQVQFGVIMVLTISYSFITSIFLLPLILASWANWSKKRKGYIVSKRPAEEEYINDSLYKNLEKEKNK
jgi:predicted RND superfamily exporter protein